MTVTTCLSLWAQKEWVFLMFKIAFIDDEKNILDGVRRMLRTYRKQWDMSFYLSAEEALAAMEQSPFDIVVSDMRMPGMNGAKFLQLVKDRYPGTIRIALSGFSDSELTLESTHATQQFIAKPADADAIVLTLKRVIETSTWLNDARLQEAVGRLDGLPALPSVYDQLMQEIASENASVDRVAKIISQDIALSAGLLRMVSSAYFGLARHVEGVDQAAALLGLTTIKNLVLLTTVFNTLPENQEQKIEQARLNEESQSLSVLALRLANLTDLTERDRDHAHLAAVMSSLGELIILSFGDKFYTKFDPPLIGSYLLSLWNLPYPVIEAVRWHRSPTVSGIADLKPLAIVHASWKYHQIHKEYGQTEAFNLLESDEYLNANVSADVRLSWHESAVDYFQTRMQDK